jgi:hypothetical protein
MIQLTVLYQIYERIQYESIVSKKNQELEVGNLEKLMFCEFFSSFDNLEAHPAIMVRTNPEAGLVCPARNA